MAGGGGWGRREGSRNGGVSSPIYRLEGSWARLMTPGGGRSGPRWLDGEVAEGAAADCISGRLKEASGTRACARKGQGAGQVALEGSLVSTWPRTHRG